MIRAINASLFFILLFYSSVAQDNMRVIRTSAIDRASPIQNVFVDEENNKWVGNSLGVFQVYDIRNSVEVKSATGKVNLLSFPDGNASIWLAQSELEKIVGPSENIVTAHYDQKAKTLWIGTFGDGVYQFKVEPNLNLVSHFTIENSKLRSNNINTIFIDRAGIKWIGTEEGALVGTGADWKLEERYFNIQSFTAVGREVWILGDGLLWWVDEKGNWNPIELDQEMFEGEIIDIDFDSKGRLWMASEVVTQFDIEQDSFVVYGPVQYFTSQFVNCMDIDDEDAIWVGTEDKGLYQIEREDAITVTLLLDQPLSCDGNSKNAALSVKVVGGQEPYDFAWDQGLNGTNPSGLGTGTYKLTVTDAKGKQKLTQIEVPNPNVNATIEMQSPASAAAGNDGAAVVSVTGGVPDYNYRWDNGETSAEAKALTEGTHKVTVTDEAGCTAIASIEVSEEILPLVVSINQLKENKCYGDKNAVFEVVATGGNDPFQFNWDNPVVDNEQAVGLGAGTYTVTVTDAAGNSKTASITVNEPEAITIDLKVKRSATTNQADGAVEAKVNGGSRQYTYKWSNEESTAAAERLFAGSHSLSVTDSEGCTAITSIDMTEDILPLAADITQITPIKCAGDNQGQISVSVSGGKSPYAYKWSSGHADPILTDIAAGEYLVTITDAANNEVTLSYQVEEPEKINVDVIIDASATTDNQDGEASVKASGGSGKYTYKWDSNEEAKSASKLGPGIHVVTVTDGSGCRETAEFEITEDILPLAADISQTTPIKCAGENQGQISVSVSGGKSPYAYKWSSGQVDAILTNIGAGEYLVTITDVANNEVTLSYLVEEPEKISVDVIIDASATTDNQDGEASVKASGGSGKYTYKWDSNEEGKSASKLGPGIHVVTVTDGSGCKETAEFEITEDILPLVVSIEQTKENLCAEDKIASVTASVSGGKGPFEIAWSTSEKGNTLSGLTSGTYNVKVTDALGTVAEKDIEIKSPSQLSASVTIVQSANTEQEDGKAKISVEGGVGPYQYQWHTGETVAQAIKLGPGNHTVSATDANGCSVTAIFEITEDILPLICELNITKEISCAGESDGAIEVTVSGGKGPYTYSWQGQPATTSTVSGLKAASYEVIVTDVSGLEQKATVNLVGPKPLQLSILEQRPARLETTSDGLANIEARGGTAPYTYSWDNGESNAQAEKLSFGAHKMTVTDANGCSASIDLNIEKKILPDLTAGMLKDGQTIRMEKLQFQADSSAIEESSTAVLNELYSFLAENPFIVVEIGGHTNGLPPHDFCDRLSSARAKAVSQYLIDKGIDPKRVFFKGYGKRKPIATNQTPDGRRKNQRVEVKILRIEEG